MPLPIELAQELAAWEAASDEDWLNLEATLATVDVAVDSLGLKIRWQEEMFF